MQQFCLKGETYIGDGAKIDNLVHIVTIFTLVKMLLLLLMSFYVDPHALKKEAWIGP